MAGRAGAVIGGAAGYQPPIGAYVEAGDETKIAGVTNYIGCGSRAKYVNNVLGEGSIVVNTAPQPNFVVEDNDGDAIGNTSQWVRAAGTIAENGTCTVTAGAATAGAGTFSCYVPGGVVVGDFFWAVVTAE